MCANYTPTRADRLNEFFGAWPLRADYVDDAYPGHPAPIIRADPDQRRADLAVFGLIPHWSRDGRNYRQCYNARLESVAEKPSFRDPWRQQQRCVVPADAFFEPSYETGKAVRWRIERADGAPMAIAGLWERWHAPNGEAVLSFSMLTINADPHPVMNRFHAPGDEKRSVVLLADDDVQHWLERGREQDLRALIAPFPPELVRTACDPRPPRRPAV